MDYLCCICGASKKDECDLARHISTVHDKRLHICNICNKQLEGSKTLYNHMRNHKSKPNKNESTTETSKEKLGIKCDKCPYIATRNNVLKRHQLTCQKKKVSQKISYECSYCGKLFEKKYTLTRHLISHEQKVDKPKSHSCDICSQEFTEMRNMKRHLTKIHGVKEKDTTTTIESSIGFFKFEDNINIDKNIKVKQEKNTNSCENCDYNSEKKSNFARHIATVHKNKDVNKPSMSTNSNSCEICDYKSEKKSNIERHISTVHKNVKIPSIATVFRKRQKLVDEMNDDDMNYIYKKLKTNEPQIDKEDIAKLMSNTSLSNKELLKCLSIMRNSLGRKKFQANLRDYIKERTNMLDDIIKTEIDTFINSDGEDVELPLTTVTDMKLAISLLCLKRDIDPEKVDIVLGLDGGQGKIILTMTLNPHNQPSKKERQKIKRKSKKYKGSSTKRAFVAARVEDVPESYENLKKILDALDLPSLSKEFRVVGDF